MTQKIIIIRKRGTYKIRGNGDEYLMELTNGAFHRGEMKPTFWQNVKRFFSLPFKGDQRGNRRVQTDRPQC